MLVTRSEQKLSTWAIGFHVAGAAVVVAVAGAAFLLLLRPVSVRHARVVEKTASLQAVLEHEERLRREHERLSQSLLLAEQKVESLLERVPNVPREADFLGQVTTLAHDVGLEIIDYRPGGTAQREEYQEMTVSLTAEGSYPGVCSFLRRLHGLPRLSRVHELKIAPQANGEAYSTNMTLAIYFAPEHKLGRPEAPEANDG